MNKWLLDTHILLWSLLEPAKLSVKVADELDNPESEIWLSPISTWEVIVLAEKGRIKLNKAPALWMENVLSTMPMQQAPLNHEVAMQSRSIQLPHQDPADRFLAATAIVYGLTLVTADRNLIEHAKEYSTLPNIK